MSRIRTAAAVLLLTVASPPANAMHPIAQTAADTLAEPGSPFVMLVTFKVDASKADAFEAAMAEPLQATVKEPGNLAYALSRSVDDPETYLLYEHWKSVEALDSHLAEPYLVKLGESLDALLAEPPRLDFYVPTP